MKEPKENEIHEAHDKVALKKSKYVHSRTKIRDCSQINMNLWLFN